MPNARSQQPSSSTDVRKRSLYFPKGMFDDIRNEAKRQDRSISRLVQYAWALAEKKIKSMPSPKVSA